MSQNATEKNQLDNIKVELHRITAQRDLLTLALESLLEHEGTVDSTGIGDFPSEALRIARNQGHRRRRRSESKHFEVKREAGPNVIAF